MKLNREQMKALHEYLDPLRDEEAKDTEVRIEEDMIMIDERWLHDDGLFYNYPERPL